VFRIGPVIDIAEEKATDAPDYELSSLRLPVTYDREVEVERAEERGDAAALAGHGASGVDERERAHLALDGLVELEPGARAIGQLGELVGERLEAPLLILANRALLAAARAHVLFVLGHVGVDHAAAFAHARPCWTKSRFESTTDALQGPGGLIASRVSCDSPVMRIAFATLAATVLALSGCDEGVTSADDGGTTPLMSACPGPGCMISGTIAICALGYACDIPPGESQDVQCGAGTVCTGSCGNSCDIECTEGATCDVTTGDSTSSSCDASTCVIEAGESASYDCTNGAMCDVTAGEGSSLDCASGSTCDFVCTSTCSANCGGDSTCTVQCPGDEAPRDFEGEVSCE